MLVAMGNLKRRARILVGQYPDSGYAWKTFGVSLAVQGKVNDALPVLKNAAELQPDDADTLNNLGNAFNELGQSDDAVVTYRRALVINPDFAEVHYNLGFALHDLGRLEDAEKKLSQSPGNQTRLHRSCTYP